MKRKLEDKLLSLQKSKFRSNQKLSKKLKKYVRDHDDATLRQHASEILSGRLFVKYPPRDGKQTPYRGHPIFVAQHATGTCCRTCLSKCHKIAKGKVVGEKEQTYIIELIMEWINRNK